MCSRSALASRFLPMRGSHDSRLVACSLAWSVPQCVDQAKQNRHARAYMDDQQASRVASLPPSKSPIATLRAARSRPSLAGEGESALPLLLLDDRGRRSRRGYGVRMTVHELPSSVFAAEDARHAERDLVDVVASSDLGLEALDLQDVRQVVGHALREVLEVDRSPVSIVAGRSLPRLLDLGPAAGRRPERIGQRRVVAVAV